VHSGHILARCNARYCNESYANDPYVQSHLAVV
jgi:hypothetical protein